VVDDICLPTDTDSMCRDIIEALKKDDLLDNVGRLKNVFNWNNQFVNLNDVCKDYNSEY